MDQDVAVIVERPAEGMAGLAKGLAIIEAFSPERPTLTVAEAARLTGVTRPAARRCLLTLAALGYLVQEGRMFRPLPRLVRLGGAYMGSAPLAEASRAILAAARDATGESVSLAVFEDNHALFVARAEARHIVAVGVRVSSRLPLWCSATGRILLAAMPPADAATLIESVERPQRTPYTLTAVPDIVAAIARARDEGVVFTNEELELGLRSVAIPVWQPDRRLAAAMSLSAAASRVSEAVMRRDMLPVLRHAADALGRLL